MDIEEIFANFEALTSKQHEALKLASMHYTSKQIAIKLNVAAVTIDKRIEAVRAKLDQMPRVDVLRHYRVWQERYDQAIDGPIILTRSHPTVSETSQQSPDDVVLFEDSLAFDARAPWDRSDQRLLPRIKPSDLGVGGKLLLMLLGAIAIIAVAVLSVAFANAIKTMV